MNDISLDDIPLHLNDIDKVRAPLMKVEILKTDTQTDIKYALNDVVVGGNLLDYYKFHITSSELDKRFHGTGVMVSTALGSSAYRLNN